MKPITLKPTLLSLLPAALLAFSSCPTEPKGEGAGFTATQPGVPGGVVVQTFTVRPDVDMTQHAVGDEVVFSTTEAVAISVEKP
ncbi:MAG: hypothetical protein WCQ21_02635 [Verrucomicrobiota bacterium]